MQVLPNNIMKSICTAKQNKLTIGLLLLWEGIELYWTPHRASVDLAIDFPLFTMLEGNIGLHDKSRDVTLPPPTSLRRWQNGM